MKILPVPILLSALFVCLPEAAHSQQSPAANPASDPFAPDNPPVVVANANAGDPFLKGGSPGVAANVNDNRNPGVMEGLVRLEYFSMPPAIARKVMRQFPKQAELYAWLGAEIEKEKSVVKLERLSLIKVRNGQRSKVEEIDEVPYPTEFDPPQIPQTMGLGTGPIPSTSVHVTTPTPAPTPAPPKPAPVPTPPPAPAPTPPPAPAPAPPKGAQGDPGSPGAPGASATIAPGALPATRLFAPWPYTTTTPSSFTFRNTGWTTELELTFRADGKTVDMNIAPEHVKFCGMVNQDAAGEIYQPGFETGKLSCQVFALASKPTLVGTINRPFNTGTPNGNTTDSVWLLFVTVNRTR